MKKFSRETQTPQSCFKQTRKSFLNPRNRFYEVFNPEEGTISQQRKKMNIELEIIRAKTIEIERDLDKVAWQAGLVHELEDEFNQLNKSSFSSEHLFKLTPEGKEAASHRSLLKKIGADLKQQLIFVQEELDAAKIQLQVSSKSNDEEAETIRIAEQTIHDDEYQITRIREISDALESEILSRENEVFQLEMKAAKHHELSIQSTQLKMELLHRKYDAERDKEITFKSFHKIELQKRQLAERFYRAKTKLSVAEEERDHLKDLETELNDLEKNLIARSNDINRNKFLFSQKKIIDAQKEMNLKEEREMKEINEMRTLAKEEEELTSTVSDMEFEIEHLTKSIETKENSLSVTKEFADKAFNARQSKLKLLCDNFISRLSKSKPPKEIEEEIEKCQKENEELRKGISEKAAGIEEIKGILVIEDEVNKMKESLQKQTRITMIQEREINSKLGAINAESKELEGDEEEMCQNMNVIKADLSLTKKQDDAIIRMRSLCKDQTEQLKKKYKLLLAEQENEKLAEKESSEEFEEEEGA